MNDKMTVFALVSIVHRCLNGLEKVFPLLAPFFKGLPLPAVVLGASLTCILLLELLLGTDSPGAYHEADELALVVI